MLVTLKEIYPIAQEKQIAIGAFNVVALENIVAVIETAEKLNVPVILAFAQTHEENRVASLDVLGPIMVMAAKASGVPVAVHLDHGISEAYIEKALKMGFRSVMFDGSSLPFEENVEMTKRVVEMAHRYGASVEGEIGKMAGVTLNHEGITENRQSKRSNYTDPDQAKRFVEMTGVDCLACSFGTVHGEYFSKPDIDFELVKVLSEAAQVPLVMHGGSGVSHADYKRVIKNGVRKINYFTYMDKAGAEGINAIYPLQYYHEALHVGQKAMQKDIEAAMRCFANMD